MNHLRRNVCAPHQSGVTPDMPPFFTPGCSVCEAKKEAGKVTGNEPLPLANHNTRAGRNRAIGAMWVGPHQRPVR